MAEVRPGTELSADKEWYRKRTISSWRRVIAATCVFFASFAVYALASESEFAPIARLVCIPLILLCFGFIGASLSISLIYKINNGFSRSDWMFRENNIMLFFIIRDIIR